MLGRRYATALFDVTHPRGDADAAGQELEQFARLVADHPELSRVLETPLVPAPKKQAIITALLAKMGGTSDEIRRLLLMLAERDRLAYLAHIAAAFADRLRASRNIVRARVVTAVPLADAQRAALEQALSKAAGAQLAVEAKVDPSIVGGVIARVGSMVFDGSVVMQIARMHQQLLHEA